MTRIAQPDTKALDAERLRRDFPILQQEIHPGRRLIYLDNAATTQHPSSVIAAVVSCYERTYANVHRGIHALSEQSTADYEHARNQIAQFVGADSPRQILFSAGTTGSVNCVARAWGDDNIRPGDEIVLSVMEHHSNIVPWQQLAQRKGAVVRFADITSDGRLDIEHYQSLLGPRTRMVALAAISNVLGTINPIPELVRRAHDCGALVLVDAAQHVPHAPTDLRSWDADFVCFSGHKMLGPSGLGILYGRHSLLESMPPFLGGGSMIREVTTEGFSPAELPAKFEAGTPPIAAAIGTSAAIDYLSGVGMESIGRHEQRLVRLAMDLLGQIDGVTVLGPTPEKRAGIVSFVVEGLNAQDIAILLDRQGIAIRAGHHCAMPLHSRLGVPASCRASFYLYNTEDDVRQLAESLRNVIGKLR
jgi:cysteine desulfurase/selenocysteine lyase